MLKSYKTFFQSAQSEIVEKKSRFIGHGAYVSTEDEAQQFISSIRKEQRGANHNCFAYRLEGGTILERQSDDGEPGGTAGLPILDVLRGNEIVNGVIVVTRYFGGTLLGTGGLVRAYTNAAKACLLEAGIVEKALYSNISVTVDYSLSGKIEYELNKNGIIMGDILYTESVEFMVYIPLEEEDNFCKSIENITSANARINNKGALYGGIVDGKFRLL